MRSADSIRSKLGQWLYQMKKAQGQYGTKFDKHICALDLLNEAVSLQVSQAENLQGASAALPKDEEEKGGAARCPLQRRRNARSATLAGG